VPRDVVPGYWTELDKLIVSGDLRATEEVREEIAKKHDEILEWAKQRPTLFVPIDEEIQELVREILTEHRQIIDSRRGRSGADPWVIALAMMNSCAVITMEDRSYSDSRPRIPDVCEAYGIKWLSVVDLIRIEGWQFN
jgi:peptidoglycan/xylan/chitin deacetylase (PgdA/CDA1 family)